MKGDKIETQVSKPRGHRKEHVEVNQAIIALYICGFPKRAIARLLNKHKPNILKVIKKYFSKYSEEIIKRVKDFIKKEKRNE